MTRSTTMASMSISMAKKAGTDIQNIAYIATQGYFMHYFLEMSTWFQR